MNIYDMTHALARALQQHPDVQAMREAKQKVDQDPQAKRMLDDFMAKSMQLQMQEMSGSEPDEEAKQQLQKLAEIVFLHADIRQFQELGVRVERMVQDIYGIISGAVSFEESEV